MSAVPKKKTVIKAFRPGAKAVIPEAKDSVADAPTAQALEPAANATSTAVSTVVVKKPTIAVAPKKTTTSAAPKKTIPLTSRKVSPKSAAPVVSAAAAQPTPPTDALATEPEQPPAPIAKKATKPAAKVAKPATASKGAVVKPPTTPSDDTTAEIVPLREGVRAIFADSFAKAIRGSFRPDNIDATHMSDQVTALEDAIYAAATNLIGELPGYCTHRRAYADIRLAVSRQLTRQVDICPDDTIGLMYITGRVGADDVVGFAVGQLGIPTAAEYQAARKVGRKGSAPPPPAVKKPAEPAIENPISLLLTTTDAERDIIRRLFAITLMRADARFADDTKLTAETARAIETSCFNTTVRMAKQSEEPPRRHWDSPAFLELYSTRCGAICGLLDPTSSSSLTYHSVSVVTRLLTGDLTPSALGEMTERELCPAATEAERREIEERSRQCVTAKVSTMFQCPHCGERSCTFREVQRRSLDEAPDYLCVCLQPTCRRRFTGKH